MINRLSSLKDKLFGAKKEEEIKVDVPKVKKAKKDK